MEEWLFYKENRIVCKVIEKQTLWGQLFYRVWLPDQDAIVRVSADQLKPLEEACFDNPSYISYIASAARVSDALTQDVLLAPLESNVIPLPHQIKALSQAVSGDRVRYLLADEVGLGKTVEAGLIMRELKLRGLIRRILVVAPKGLVTQWAAEMRTHFNETFHIISPDDLSSMSRLLNISAYKNRQFNGKDPQDQEESNPWKFYDQIIVSMDSVKPIDKRRGWNTGQLSAYNRDRFENLITAGWDLIIIDESHRLGGSTDQVARFKLGQGLAEASPYLLLLSATPHQGKTGSFYRLISLLDSEMFPDVASIKRERIQPYVIRTEKRSAIDSQGNPLFKPRQTRMIPISWTEAHKYQQILYKEVTDYVREGYNQAKMEKRNYIGFLMILMQRLVTSSTRAIRTTLERRLEVLKNPETQISLFSSILEDEWEDLDTQEQLETIIKSRLSLKSEKNEVEHLLEIARKTEAAESDAKANALLDWIYRLQQEENEPNLKILLFTEFVPTQEMLRDFLTDRGFSVVCLNGSMDMDERIKIQESFANEARILISTDAGGEGLNLQFCHVVVNYDIPWNPMKLEQRIGRVDRIGQNHIVQAINFVLEDTVEFRVREVLEEKLAVILREFGIDKTGDVLDSAQAGQMFDEIYIEAILDPEKTEDKINSFIEKFKEQAQDMEMGASLLGNGSKLSIDDVQRLKDHPLPYWVEKMTVNYLLSNGGTAEKQGRSWNLTWPDGLAMKNVVFTLRDADLSPYSYHLTLEDSKIRGLSMGLQRFVPGQPIPVIIIPGISKEINGFWSLWRVSIHTADWNRNRMMPLFIHDDGRILMPTAQNIWDKVINDQITIKSHITGEDVLNAFNKNFDSAQVYGKNVFDQMLQFHKEQIQFEKQKGEYSFAARRRAIERIGLQTVKSYRMAKIAKEEAKWREELERKGEVIPEMVPLLIVRIEGH